MDARDKIIEDLRRLVAKQSEEIATLTARVAELELALAKATKDSSTSSKPQQFPDGRKGRENTGHA